ncbi:unnamed protein product [Caenorhabditis angaria]|uniref:Uncharacterized protein n=1 Tax=Caenorhabditis angaria TaxID=860376 RepID=A0A9P1N0W1_9PELO|nr:unnamed protein product [Caenorhabditis angaria]
MPTSIPGTSSSSSFEGCAVCGDRVNGNRYGAPACLGCIVFFRRAVTNDVTYKCLKGGQCVITNESRCICRYCRLQKCYTVGMKASAIQRRDVMGPRKPKTSSATGNSATAAVVKQEIVDDTPMLKCQSNASSSSGVSVTGGSPVSGTSLIDALVKLQQYQVRNHRSFFAAHEEMEMNGDIFAILNRKINGDNFRRARAHDVNTMLRLGLLDAAQWANQFEPFRRLPLAEKKHVLTEFGFTFMLVDQGYRTAQRAERGFWLLQNDTFMHEDYFLGLPEDAAKLDQAKTKAKLHPLFINESLESVGYPMKDLEIDEFECAVLKTVLLLGHKNHFGQSPDSLKSLLSRCFVELMDYCKRKCPENAAERAGTVLLFTSSIRCSIKALYNQTRVSDVFSLMKFDPLVIDVLLS